MSYICIIGTGNVAWHFHRILLHAGHRVVQIVGRSIEKASSITSDSSTQLIDNLDNVTRSAEVYLVCVNDDSIADVVESIKALIPEKALVLHTSGTQSIQVLEPIQQAITGSVWPIQSLTKGINIDVSKIPIAISAKSKTSSLLILDFVKSLGTPFRLVDEADKLKLHLAAVMVNNFTNHIVTLTQEYMDAEKLDFELVKPLLNFTIQKLDVLTARESQTGPAKRGDLITIKKHLSILTDQPELQAIYKLISESIAANYKDNIKK